MFALLCIFACIALVAVTLYALDGYKARMTARTWRATAFASTPRTQLVTVARDLETERKHAYPGQNPFLGWERPTDGW